MTLEFVIRYWALLLASALGVAIFMFVLYRLYEASARGRLNQHVGVLRARKVEALRAQRRLDKATDRHRSLRSRAESIKPIDISNAAEALQDAQSLKQISDDQVLRAQKLLRDVILEEFPPNRQDGLREKYL